jgi:uncharacterized surface protein with fasciclin (FAS1) repeats
MEQDSITFSSGVEGLDDVILFHAVDTQVLFKKDLPCTAGQNLITSAMGKTSRTLCEDDTPHFQKGKGNSDNALPKIVNFDIQACNGVIHTVDKVLLFETLE